MKKAQPIRKPIRVVTRELTQVVGGIGERDNLTNTDTIRSYPTK